MPKVTRRYDHLVDTLEQATTQSDVVCEHCAGRHLTRLCPALDAELRQMIDADLQQRVHGTLAQAQRERRDGGHASMCPACKAVWQADQAKHRARRRG